MLVTKTIYFVKLSKCELDLTIAFISSRWEKSINGTFNSEFR